MPLAVKAFGAGAILSTILGFVITGIMGWFGMQTVKIPSFEYKLSKAASEVEAMSREAAALNTNMMVLSSRVKALTEQAEKTNEALLEYTEHNAQNIGMLTTSLAKMSVKITQNTKDCERLNNGK